MNNPQHHARRLFVHGPVLPMRPEGEPSLFAGTMGFIAAVGGLVAFFAALDFIIKASA